LHIAFIFKDFYKKPMAPENIFFSKCLTSTQVTEALGSVSANTLEKNSTVCFGCLSCLQDSINNADSVPRLSYKIKIRFKPF
jgi:hypothetical protein